jgi:hypothetical protein
MIMTGLIGFIGTEALNQGIFLSPDPIFEKAVSVFVKTPAILRGQTVKLLGVCKIGDDPASQKLRLALNSIFAHVNQLCTLDNTTIKYKTDYLNVLVKVPELYSTIPNHCPIGGNAENCASFFTRFISSDLLKCAFRNFEIPHPHLCKFGEALACDDCGERDFAYASSLAGGADGAGGTRKRRRRRTRRFTRNRRFTR